MRSVPYQCSVYGRSGGVWCGVVRCRRINVCKIVLMTASSHQNISVSSGFDELQHVLNRMWLATMMAAEGIK